MSDKKIIKPKKERPQRDKDIPKPKYKKDPKYKHSSYWLSQEEDYDDEDFNITDIFGKDEEE